MPKLWSNSKSSSSAPVDYFDLCTHTVRNIEDRVSNGNLLNQAQCKDLSIKLSKVVLNIRELVDECGGSANLFRAALEDLHRCLEKAKVLVNKCGEEEWCAAAVFQIHNENAFREVIMEVSLCYNAIYEQAKSMSEATTINVQDLRGTQFKVFEPAGSGDIFIDQEELEKRLEGFAKEPRSVKVLDHLRTDKVALKQGLANYLLRKIKFTCEQSRAISLEACNEIFWHKESELPGTWGKSSHFLGSGAVGGVCKTKWMGIRCAKKVFRAKEHESLFLKEACIMAHLKHPCVIDFLCCGNGHERGDLYIAMELMEKSLGELIEDQNGVYFPILVAMDMILQIARGVYYLQERGVAHRDLKLENVVVSKLSSQAGKGYYCVKLVDFGMSKTKVELSKSNTMTFMGIGTTKYKAPEVFKQAHLDGKVKPMWFKADAYSFAITCVHLLSLKAPFGGIQNVDELYNKLMSGERPHFPMNCPKELAAILTDCWNTKPSSRPSFKKIVSRLEEFRHKLLREYEEGDGHLGEGSMEMRAGLEYVKTQLEEQSLIQTSCVLSIDEDVEEEERSKQDLPILSCALGHALEFLSEPPSKYRRCLCDLCWKDINNELYHCDICQFDAHLECATIEVEVKVFFHDHPLHLLIKSYYIDHHDAKCGLCNKALHSSEWVYNCQKCGFDVHALCMKYSREKFREDWHSHRLTLDQCPLDKYLSCTCCNGEITTGSFLYGCSNRWCPFEVHPSCIVLPTQPLCMFGDGHRLSLVYDQSGFYCGRCGALGFSWSYHCDQCDMDVHLDCINDTEGEESHWNDIHEEMMTQLTTKDTLQKMDMITRVLDTFHLNNPLEENLSSTSMPSTVLEGCMTTVQPRIRSLASSGILDLGAIDFENVVLRKEILTQTAERKVTRVRAKAGRRKLKVKMLEELERIVMELRSCESVREVDGEVLDSRLKKLRNLQFIVEDEMARLVQRTSYAPRTCLFSLVEIKFGVGYKLLTTLQASMKGVHMWFLCEEPCHQHIVRSSRGSLLDWRPQIYGLGEQCVRKLQPLLGCGLEVVARAMRASAGQLSPIDCVTLPILGSENRWDLRAIDLEKHGEPSKEEEDADALRRAEDCAAEWILSDKVHGGWRFEFRGLFPIRYKVTEEGDHPGYTRGSMAWLCKEHFDRALEADILESYPQKYYNFEANFEP